MIEYAGFMRRVLAYFLDVIPITAMVVAVHVAFLGFDVTFERYLNRDPRDVEARARFLAQRNDIRNTSLMIYVVYASVLEASTLRGTLGKWVLGIVVADRDGNRVGFTTAVVRNITKPISFFPCGLGCLWVMFNSERRAWHDYFAGTVVIFRDVPELQNSAIR